MRRQDVAVALQHPSRKPRQQHDDQFPTPWSRLIAAGQGHPLLCDTEAMTEPGPPGPEQPSGGQNFGAPQQVPGMYPPAPGPVPAKQSRTGWALFAVIAVIAVVMATVAAVVVIRHVSGAQDSETSEAASTSSSTGAGPTPLRSVHLAAPHVVTKPGSTEPKATLKVYEDFLCPYCGRFEQVYGPTIQKLIADGRIAVDYTMVSILGRGDPKSYSVRAGAAAYCVADADVAAFQRFHATLFAKQPEETAGTFPSDDQLIAQAREAGAPDSVAGCITSGTNRAMVNTAVKSAGITSTPTVLLNGTDIGDAVLLQPDPQALLDQLKTVS
ncbi:thioredoxin domain-containing protein [Mycobacterium sp. CBMA293]|nr:thioredoxin domain-containing protein [Mycolicibacterium sp. CBMA 360]MUL58150.1 thioredoxin domain-containing protein [Mycolicibacterium sp. CBMA 335]MUL73608.1 thioredoxin domain-containing protein [Mycolicibacterium sp. CBMA 311]MUL93033.1 thioredoxin domain-containing protein [Mycolicibacterium sp. CBMA 230]MUM09876.1 thioredoxin domain-containing protein [Mycolicibacterium sp. CBMA 293]MUM35529.1 thioredoxin domain-containing protein [Mycolicibacterium sp. CBMA 361]